MLRSLKQLERYTVTATDGDIGHAGRFLLDSRRWMARYLVVHPRGLFKGRDVLVSPASFLNSDRASLKLNLNLTKDEVQRSPAFDSMKPFSRQLEGEFSQYYGNLPYWGFEGHWGPGTYPRALEDLAQEPANQRPTARAFDVRLHSDSELRGYHVLGTDKGVGHVEDFIIDEETWEVRYLVIDTSNWWFGKKALIAPRWTTSISWEDKLVYVDLSHHAIGNCPMWDPAMGVARSYEALLHDHYGYQQYWV